MRVSVISHPVEPVEPEQRVVLELSVKEFAMLAHLVYMHLGGDSNVRHSLEDGIYEAEAYLSPNNRELLRKARCLPKGGGWNSVRVEEIFA